MVNGGIVPSYHQFGNFISSGVVGTPTGRAASDAAGLQRGTDTYAATLPAGSFVLNRAASQMFGHKYLAGGGQSGGVAAILTPGEIVISPQQVARHGLANITRGNAIGRQMQRRQIGGPIYSSAGLPPALRRTAFFSSSLGPCGGKLTRSSGVRPESFFALTSAP